MRVEVDHPRALLDQLAGAYHEVALPPEVARTFDCAWLNQMPEDLAAPVLVMPDGAVDIVWHGSDLLVVGPDRVASPERPPPGAAVVGLRFQPGAAAAWLGVPMHELVGRKAALREFWRSEQVDRLVEQLLASTSPTGALRTMVGAVAHSPPNKFTSWAAQVIGVLEVVGNEAAIIPALIQATGMSERSLRRRCSDIFGFGPRTISRIIRFQRFLAALRKTPNRPLASVAIGCGYADQAHMTREVREFSTLTPAEIAVQHHET